MNKAEKIAIQKVKAFELLFSVKPKIVKVEDQFKLMFEGDDFKKYSNNSYGVEILEEPFFKALYYDKWKRLALFAGSVYLMFKGKKDVKQK